MVHLNLHINESEEHEREHGTVVIKENWFFVAKKMRKTSPKIQTDFFVFLSPPPPKREKCSVLIIAGFIFN